MVAANSSRVDRQVAFRVRSVAPHIALACVLVLLLVLSFAHYHRRHARNARSADLLRELSSPSSKSSTTTTTTTTTTTSKSEKTRVVVITPPVRPQSTAAQLPDHDSAHDSAHHSAPNTAQRPAHDSGLKRHCANTSSMAETEMTELTTSGLDTLSEEAFAQLNINAVPQLTSLSPDHTTPTRPLMESMTSYPAGDTADTRVVECAQQQRPRDAGNDAREMAAIDTSDPKGANPVREAYADCKTGKSVGTGDVTRKLETRPHQRDPYKAPLSPPPIYGT